MWHKNIHIDLTVSEDRGSRFGSSGSSASGSLTSLQLRHHLVLRSHMKTQLGKGTILVSWSYQNKVLDRVA